MAPAAATPRPFFSDGIAKMSDATAVHERRRSAEQALDALKGFG